MIENGSKWRRYSRPGKIDTFFAASKSRKWSKNDEKLFKMTTSLHKWSNCKILNDLDILNVDKNDHIHDDCMSDTVPNEQFT